MIFFITIRKRVKLVKIDGHWIVLLIRFATLAWGVYILFFEKKDTKKAEH